MGFRIQGELKGLNNLIRSFDELGKKGLRRATRSGMRKTASVMNKSAKALEQVGQTGATKRSLGVKVKTYPSGIVIGIVQPRGGFGTWRVRYSKSGQKFLAPVWHDPVKVAHLIERGTRVRKNRYGANRGAMPAHPFIGPAFVTNEPKAEPIFAAELEKELEKVRGA